MKIFGSSKASNPKIMNYLSKIIQRYDIIFLQEIRDASGNSILKLLDLVNESANNSYGAILSPRLGRTKYNKEQYAYFFNIHKVIPLAHYIYNNNSNFTYNSFLRSPYVVKFQTNNFIFSIIGVHISPSFAFYEIEQLLKVYKDSIYNLHEDKTIILGDLNADCSYLNEHELAYLKSTTRSHLSWQIHDNIDTTTKWSTDCAYDRIIVSKNIYNYVVPQSAMVYNFQQYFNLSESVAYDISDHYPVEITLQIP